MHWPTNRNILYAPLFIGCLNLIAILYGFGHLQDTKKKRIQTIHRFMLPYERKNKDIFSVWTALKEFKKRKVVEYVLKGDAEDDSRLDIIRLHALQIKYSCDTNTVIKVHLRDNTTYGEFISLLDMMLAGKHKRYMFYQNNFYIVPPRPDDCLEEEQDLPFQPLFI